MAEGPPRRPIGKQVLGSQHVITRCYSQLTPAPVLVLVLTSQRKEWTCNTNSPFWTRSMQSHPHRSLALMLSQSSPPPIARAQASVASLPSLLDSSPFFLWQTISQSFSGAGQIMSLAWTILPQATWMSTST